jgi:hypothetical protein
MTCYLIWSKNPIGLYKIAENETDLNYLKEFIGNETILNNHYHITETTEEIFNSLQNHTRSFNSGTSLNPVWDVHNRIYKNFYEWWSECDFILNPINTWKKNNPNHVLITQLEKWTFFVEGSKGSSTSFTYPYSQNNVLDFCKTLLNPVGKPAGFPVDRAFSPLQLP